MLIDTSLKEFIGRGFRNAVIGILAILFLAMMFVAFVPIPRSVVANGSVTSVRETRSVQHDLGGLVEAVPVLDGDFVEKGDTIIAFDATALKAEQTALATEIVTLSAERESLLSAGDDDSFSQTLNQLAGAYNLEADLVQQADRASAKQDAVALLKTQLKDDISSLQTRHKARLAERVAKKEQLALVQGLIERRGPLVAEGFVSRSDLNRLQIEEASLRSGIERLNGDIANIEGAIAKATTDSSRIPRELDFERLTRLSELTRQIAERRMRLTQVERQLANAVVAAPVSGQVIGLNVNTIGSFVSPADSIAMIVPNDEELVIDVQINPKDIDVVGVGMAAKVVFSAFPQRALPEISAEVESITHDVLTDPSSGRTYYRLKLRIPDELTALLTEEEAMALFPGMPVDVFIPVRRASILQYIWTPVRQSFRASFRA